MPIPSLVPEAASLGKIRLLDAIFKPCLAAYSARELETDLSTWCWRPLMRILCRTRRSFSQRNPSVRLSAM